MRIAFSLPPSILEYGCLPDVLVSLHSAWPTLLRRDTTLICCVFIEFTWRSGVGPKAPIKTGKRWDVAEDAPTEKQAHSSSRQGLAGLHRTADANHRGTGVDLRVWTSFGRVFSCYSPSSVPPTGQDFSSIPQRSAILFATSVWS